MRNPALSLVAATGFAAPALADGDRGLATFQVRNRAATLQMAQAAMTACRDKSYQIGVSVVDRFATPQVLPRDRFAGTHVHKTAQRQARTALRYHGTASALGESTNTSCAPCALGTLTNTLPPAGRLMVTQANRAVVAGIGLSGAPEPVPGNIGAQAGRPSTEDKISL